MDDAGGDGGGDQDGFPDTWQGNGVQDALVDGHRDACGRDYSEFPACPSCSPQRAFLGMDSDDQMDMDSEEVAPLPDPAVLAVPARAALAVPCCP